MIENRMMNVYQNYVMQKRAEAAQAHMLKLAAQYFRKRQNSLHVKRAGYNLSIAELTHLTNAARGILREKMANSKEQQELQNALQRLSGVYQAATSILQQRGYNR